MRWIRYTIETTTAAEDFVSGALADLGIEGVEIENKVPLTEAETAKMFIDFPPELPPDDGISLVSFYLEAETDSGSILPRVREAIGRIGSFVDVGSGQITETETEDADWADNWKEFFHPFVIEGEVPGRDILIKPAWEQTDTADEGRIVIEIDPGMSFGTGQHETTRLCILQLMKHVKTGCEVLDLGFGSGILSVAALKLGAAHVTGTDIDEDCLISVRENFAANGLDGGLGDFYIGNLIDDASLRERVGVKCYDIVVANILADVIIPLLPAVSACIKEEGIFIASGIIDFKEAEVTECIEATGFAVLEVTREGEWVSITAGKGIDR